MSPTVMRCLRYGLLLALSFLLALPTTAQVFDGTFSASDGDAFDSFAGADVALNADGKVALVGVPSNEINGNDHQGTAYVFAKTASGSWSEQQKLIASDGEGNDQLGESVALSADGTVALVGAHRDDIANQSGDDNVRQGSAYVFSATGSGSWVQEAKITASDGAGDDYFGGTVALSTDGTVALVGSSSGKAYVFSGDGTGTWTEQAKLSSSSGLKDAVDLGGNGSTAIVEADDEGAHLFSNDAGTWRQQTKLASTTATSGCSGEQSSFRLDDDGLIALIGKCIYSKDASSSWSLEKMFEGPNDGISFGNYAALSADGTVALYGTPNANVNSTNDGSAHVYSTHESGSWSKRGRLTAHDGALGDGFGGSVALSVNGSTALVGAAGASVSNNDNQGRAYVFDWPAATTCAQRSVSSNSAIDFAGMGVTVQLSGVSTSGNLTACTFGTPPSGANGISERNVSTYRQIITAESGLSFTSAEVRFAVSELGGISDPTGVTIYKRSPAGTGTFSALSTQVDENGTPSDGTDDEIYATTSSFSEFVFASDSQPLPVELASFDATSSDGSVTLSWKTASERNNAGFRVQQRRKEGPWSQVGYVESKAGGGTSADATTYSFTAEDLAVGTHQFRLKQVDLDGTTHVHEPTTVTLGMQDAQRLSAPAPNPVSGRSVVSFAVKEEVDTKVTLYNVLGQKVTTLYEGTPRAEETQTLQIDASELASGVYMLRLEAGGQSTTQRVTVVR